MNVIRLEELEALNINHRTSIDAETIFNKLEISLIHQNVTFIDTSCMIWDGMHTPSISVVGLILILSTSHLHIHYTEYYGL
ncbi:hypothetical protein Leryth_014344 [Lithospermum erythrorhizon]|nr:hypothetical protein Leryth_014344 [Lithospermum erythrorhizon]